jgi:hypothetical protein
MSTKDFFAAPWKKSYESYETSSFNIRPAPEFSTAEVAVASLYRGVGFGDHKETDVPKAGREFDRQGQKQSPGRGKISKEGWRSILHGVLESPKQPNQSSKRFLQLMPVVPDIALYSGSARLAGNSWNPGMLVQRMIQLGCATQVEARDLWDRLYGALSVSAEDDIWARWLQEELQVRRKLPVHWRKVELDSWQGVPKEEKEQIRFPAKQFVRDLDAVIHAKHSMTRRQWISLLEALVRLAAVTHVIWLCRLNERLWAATSSALGISQGGLELASEADVRTKIITSDRRYLSYGNPAVPMMRDYASGYLVARLGLNLVLWSLDDLGESVRNLQSSSDLWKFVTLVQRNKSRLVVGELQARFYELVDTEARTVACKKGIGSNLVEFARHTLGQRQTNDDSLRGYDQSYFLQKRSQARNSQWIVGMGPVALLCLVHCCLREAGGPRSVQRLADHLAAYGMEVPMEDIRVGDVGKKLRMLGLVLDSPDAESGMLLVPPFSNSGMRAA